MSTTVLDFINESQDLQAAALAADALDYAALKRHIRF